MKLQIKCKKKALLSYKKGASEERENCRGGTGGGLGSYQVRPVSLVAATLLSGSLRPGQTHGSESPERPEDKARTSEGAAGGCRVRQVTALDGHSSTASTSMRHSDF